MENIQEEDESKQIQPALLNANKYSKYTLVFILVTVFLLVAVGSYSLGQKKGRIAVTQPTIIPTYSQSKTNDDTTSKNKVYNNEKLKFSVSYPENLQIKEFTSQYDDTFSLIIFDRVESGEFADIYNKSISIIVGGSDFQRSDFYYGGYEWTKSVIDALINEPNGTIKDHKYDTITKLYTTVVPGFSVLKYLATVKAGTNTDGLPGSSKTHWAILENDTNRTFLLSGSPEWINGVKFNYNTVIIRDESIPGDHAIVINLTQ